MRDDLRRHLERTNNIESMLTDVTTKYSMEFASNMLDLVEMALRDEGVYADVAQRVLDKVIYGVVPNRADVEMRQQLMAELTDAEMRTISKTLRLHTPEEVDAAMRRLQGSH